MLQDINGKVLTSPIHKSRIEPHWNDYIQYQHEIMLSDLSKKRLKELIEIKKKEPNPYIDSASLVSDLLNEFGKEHQFHRNFNETFPHFTSGSILGMQLYILLLDDSEEWVFYKSKKLGHLYSNSTYILLK